MTPEAIRQALFTQLNDNWTATEIAWPNKSFDPDSETAFIKPWTQMGSSFLGELGELGVGIRYGIFGVSIYMPVDDGTNLGNEYATIIEGLFRRKDLDGVITNEPSTNEMGKDTIIELNYYRIDVSVPFSTFIGE